MKKLVIALFVIVALACTATPAPADSWEVDFTWTPNTEADLAGYKLFYRFEGEQYDYENNFADVPKTAPPFTLTGDMVNGGWKEGDYYFVLRAYDTGGLESDNSNECTTNIDLPPSKPGMFSCTPRKVD